MGKIDDLGLVEEILDLVSKGMSARAIARHFKEHGIIISRSTINRFIKNIPTLVEQLTQRDESLKKRVVNSTLDTSERISFIAQEAATIYKKARLMNDLPTSLRALHTIGDACELRHKLIGSSEEAMDIVQLIQKFDPESEYRKAIENVYNRRTNG